MHILGRNAFLSIMLGRAWRASSEIVLVSSGGRAETENVTDWAIFFSISVLPSEGAFQIFSIYGHLAKKAMFKFLKRSLVIKLSSQGCQGGSDVSFYLIPVS